MKDVTHIDFRDVEQECEGFAVVRSGKGEVGLALSLVGHGDFEIFVQPSVARTLADALICAAGSAA